MLIEAFPEIIKKIEEQPGPDQSAETLFGSDSPAAVHMDLEHLHRISSAGLNELINMNRQSKSRGARFVLENVHESLRDVFALTRLERMFEFAEHSAEPERVGVNG